VSYDTDIGALSIDHMLEGKTLVNAKVFVYMVVEFFIPASVLGAIIYALATVAPTALGWLLLAVVFIMPICMANLGMKSIRKYNITNFLQKCVVAIISAIAVIFTSLPGWFEFIRYLFGLANYVCLISLAWTMYFTKISLLVLLCTYIMMCVMKWLDSEKTAD